MGGLAKIHDAMIDAQDADDRYSDPTILYRYFTRCGRLLYVGITGRPTERHWQHSGKRWAPFAAYMRVCYFPVRFMAQYAEACAYRDEFPEHNDYIRPPARWPRSAIWYQDKMQGSCDGEGAFWLSLEDWHNPAGCDAPDFTADPN